MPEFQFKNGQPPLAYEEFPINEKNLRKVNLVRDGADSEGVWAAFSDEGVKQYDSDKGTSAYSGVCILQNNALHFFPRASWGLYVPVKFNGNTRPTLDIAHMAGGMHFCKERIEQEAAHKAKEKDSK